MRATSPSTSADVPDLLVDHYSHLTGLRHPGGGRSRDAELRQCADPDPCASFRGRFGWFPTIAGVDRGTQEMMGAGVNPIAVATRKARS